jgi:hypothetical protein
MELEYSTEADAALALLEDATKVLLDSKVEFVVVGGWVPKLFHAKRFGHPGTYDVDVLLHSRSLDDGAFDLAGERLLREGYIRAVKNKFQAFRILEVAGDSLVFHVDFLNERNPGEEVSLVGGKGQFQSIYTEAMAAVFKYGPYRIYPNLGGLRFPSVEAFIATKAAAAEVKKRDRDAFDVFVTVADEEMCSFKSKWRELVESDGLFRDANDALWRAVHAGDAVRKVEAVLGSLALPRAPTRNDIVATFAFLQEPPVPDAGCRNLP